MQIINPATEEIDLEIPEDNVKHYATNFNYWRTRSRNGQKLG